ncbi:MAG TPA: hypothetical protein VD788_17545, partial [Candidatus Polarisedimenticolaceae bacterium]|nr:hypothetical protein [Candidatus Polarisedimenticolaceae bacterium]
YVACLSATHVPDHWRSKSVLGRDFTSMPRHRLLGLIRGAATEEAAGGGQANVLRLDLPAELVFELDPDQPHVLSVGLAVEVDGRFHRVDSVETEERLATGETPLTVRLTPGPDLDPASIDLAFAD